MIKRGFTIVEVSILLVIFLIVAFLVVPLSLDDTMQAKNTSRWRNVQSDFANIFYSINAQKDKEDFKFDETFNAVISSDIKGAIDDYKVTFLNGSFPNNTYRFNDYKETIGHSVLAIKWFVDTQESVKGLLMYDVNGSVGPNVWGKDVFGFNIYSDRFEPFCKNDSIAVQKQDCAKEGTGLCCSNYYLMGGSFD